MAAGAAEPIEAGAADRAALARAMAAAFQTDPVARWSSPREDLRRPMLRRFYLAMLAAKLPEGFVHTDSERRGAAIWAPPGGWRTSALNDLRMASAYLDPRLWRRAPWVAPGLLGVEARHPETPPHFYLASLGVVPEAQGQGLGSRLIEPVLRLCDSDGVGAYLESSKQSNIAFYARHGFRVTGEIQLPRGPKMFPMWRDPH